MPELPEVETTVKAINKFENKTLKEVSRKQFIKRKPKLIRIDES